MTQLQCTTRRKTYNDVNIKNVNVKKCNVKTIINDANICK